MARSILAGTAADHAPPAPGRRSQTVWPSNPATTLWGTMVGKKVVMAVTGMVLVGFVVAHMLGNLKIFLGADAIDSYAIFLRTMGEPLFPYGLLLWVVRIVLLTCVALHITAAVQLTRMNWAARPHGYEIKQSIATRPDHALEPLCRRSARGPARAARRALPNPCRWRRRRHPPPAARCPS